MERTRIDGTALECSRIGLGTWAIGGWGWGRTDEDDAVRTIRAALDQGIDLIDTAPIYGGGRAEEIVGRALQESGARDRVVVATKVGLTWRDGVVRDSSPARIREEVEASLARLRTDVIDLIQVHWPDPATPIEETAATLRLLLDAGKVRAVGVSNFSVEQMEAFRQVCPLASAQPPYNLLERGIERDVLPWCGRNGVAVLAYGALCRGMLSGRVRLDTKFPDDDLRASADPKFRPPWLPRYVRAVLRLDRLARERFDRTVLEMSVRWLLDRPGVGVALWGARRPDQLARVPRAFGFRIDEDTRFAIDAILAEEVGDGPGPEFMAPPL